MNTDATIVNNDGVAAIYKQLLQQWNKRSAAGMAALFASNGTLIGFDGSQLNGQQEIQNVLAEVFASHPTAAYVHIVKEVRSLTPGTAMLLAVVGMVAEGHKDITPAVNALQTLIVTTENGEPRIALFQNTPAAYHGRPELSDQLTADLQAVLHEANSNQEAK